MAQDSLVKITVLTNAPILFCNKEVESLPFPSFPMSPLDILNYSIQERTKSVGFFKKYVSMVCVL